MMIYAWLFFFQIFDIFLSNLNLPVNGKRAKFYFDRKGSFNGTFAKWIVYMLGGEDGGIALDHLEKLFVALKSFYHPSNHGKHSVSVRKNENSINFKFVDQDSVLKRGDMALL